MPEKTPRDATLDIMRGIGISAVVLGHTGSGFNPFVYLFHVPLFFFSSGYFFKDAYLEKPLAFLWRRIKGLYVPYVACGLVALALHNWLVTIHLYSPHANAPVGYLSHPALWQAALQTVLFYHTELILAPLWFLPVLLTVSALFFLARWLSIKMPGNGQATLFLIVTALFAAGAELIHLGIVSRWLYPESLVAMLPFAAGYWAAKYKEAIAVTWQGAVGCFVLLIASLQFGGYLDLHSGHIVSPGYFLFGALAGIYLCLCVARALTRWRFTAWLGSAVGQASLFILIGHIASFKLLALIELPAYHMPLDRLADFAIPAGSPLPWFAYYAVVGVIVPLAVYLGYGELISRRRFTPARRAA